MLMSKALSPRRRGLLGGLLVLVVAVLGYLVWQARLAPASNAAPSSSVSYCMNRFRSYNPATGTYLGNDGLRHACP